MPRRASSSTAEFRNPRHRVIVSLDEDLQALVVRRESFDGTAPTIDIRLEARDIGPRDRELSPRSVCFDAQPVVRHRLDLGAYSNVLCSPLLGVESDESLAELSDPLLLTRMIDQPAPAPVIAGP
jgi:hypothetical protein